MAVYAALVSLMNNIEQIKNHPRFSTSFHKNQIEPLSEKLDFLLDFVESYNSCHGGISKEEAEKLESEIASAAHVAEDVIESHIVDQIVAGSTEERSTTLLDLQKVVEDMDSLKEKVMKFKEECRGFKQPTYSVPPASSTPLTTGKNTMVGFDDELIQLMDLLTGPGQQSNRQIISIIGMGGMGKTTLARNVDENLLIVQHFDVRAWVIVSQEYNVREILVEALSCLRVYNSGMDEKTEEELGEQLHKSLSGMRYLVILDDIWSIEAWGKIKFFFPNNYNRSRIIVTTRISDIANHFGSLGLPLNFLDDNSSWKLFCGKAFAQVGCPPELEEIGKKIVKKCKGLLLSVVLVGGLLRNSSRMQEFWEDVAKDISSILNSEEDNQCLNILSLSYCHLPPCLKPCFLYMGIFPEDREIRVSRVIKLWIAEGFIKLNKDRSLEEVAEDYIKDLIDRNLVLVRNLRSSGKVKTCYLHDLLRDLCIRVAEKENFFSVKKMLDSTPKDIDRQRRVIIQRTLEDQYQPPWFHTVESTSFARSLICVEGYVLPFQSRLLRVLVDVHDNSIDDTVPHVNVRIICHESFRVVVKWIRICELPSSISLLWNLQTLILTGTVQKVVAPSETWEMPQLRHLVLKQICLPDPPPSDEQDDFVLRNLQTLTMALNFRCSGEVCKRIPNIKKLGISYDDFSGEGETGSRYCLHNVGRLKKLESLKCYFDQMLSRDDSPQNLIFPSSLKKLSLKNCNLHWEDMTIIGSLPHLEVLKFESGSVTGLEWIPVEGEFVRLKFLGIYSSDLIYWNAHRSHFPILERLVLLEMLDLDEIPSGIGEIPTLKDVYVIACSVSAAISAIKILEEQEGFGNRGLQVGVQFWREREIEEFREKLELEGITSHNFQLGFVDPLFFTHCEL